jgi:hypothetical protein
MRSTRRFRSVEVSPPCLLPRCRGRLHGVYRRAPRRHSPRVATGHAPTQSVRSVPISDAPLTQRLCFPQTKRPPGNRAASFLWEAVPTEARPSELSGQRVWFTPGAVKDVFGERATTMFSVIYTVFTQFRLSLPGFFRRHPKQSLTPCFSPQTPSTTAGQTSSGL